MTRTNDVSTTRSFLNIAILLTIVVVCAQAAPADAVQSDIFGKKWRLAEIEGNKFSGDAPNMEFNRDQNRVSGDAGCNRFSGGFELSGTALKFSPLISTKRACVDAERQRVENNFLRLLETITRFEVQDHALRLYAGDLLVMVLADASQAAKTIPQPKDTPKSLPEPRNPAIRDRERKAMIEFYEALGGHDWIERDFWGSDRPVGEWHGVETDAEGYVVRLTIYDNNLTGPLSPAICRLERLHTLHVSFNKISGALPEGLGECRALKNLWVKGNKITGRLPDSVAVLPELEYLDLHANDMSGPLPTVWNTPKLKIVRAEDNRISGALPAQMFRQPSLEEVFIHNNELSGPIPTTLSPALRALILANNQLTGPVPEEFGKLKKLTDLRLNRNQLTGTIPGSLLGAEALQVLRLDYNRLTGAIPNGLAKRLMVFDASNNPGLEPVK
jgi:heat shock protein HslJ